MPRSDYEPGDLYGAQVACVLDDDEVHVLGARSHARGLVLLRPDRDVAEGSLVA